MSGGILAKLKPHNCPRYPHCSAAICPLDLRWGQRVNSPDGEVCHLLRISQQTEKAESFFATYFEPGFLDELRDVLPAILKHYPAMRKGLGEAKDKPLRIRHKQKNYHKPKAVGSSPEQHAQQLREYHLNASGSPTSDSFEGVGALTYPENTIHE